MVRQQLALFLRTLDDEYQRAQKSDFYARAHVYLFPIVEYDAKDDADTQLRQVKESLQNTDGMPKAIFIAPVEEARLRGIAREAVRLGIGWVSLNRTCDYVTDLRREYPNAACLCIDPDQENVGRIQAAQVRALLPAGGNVLCVHGPLSTSSAKRRMLTFETALVGLPFRLVKEGGDWSEESGYRAGRNWLQMRAQPSATGWVVAAQNDAMATGVHRALTEHAAPKKTSHLVLPLVLGCDGLARYGQRFVVEQTLAATVIIPPTTARAIDEVAAAVRGGKPPLADVRVEVSSFPELDVLARRHRLAPPRR